jgi:hypothetical protein
MLNMQRRGHDLSRIWSLQLPVFVAPPIFDLWQDCGREDEAPLRALKELAEGRRHRGMHPFVTDFLQLRNDLLVASNRVMKRRADDQLSLF